jgi:hypothetical protein
MSYKYLYHKYKTKYLNLKTKYSKEDEFDIMTIIEDDYSYSDMMEKLFKINNDNRLDTLINLFFKIGDIDTNLNLGLPEIINKYDGNIAPTSISEKHLSSFLNTYDIEFNINGNKYTKIFINTSRASFNNYDDTILTYYEDIITINNNQQLVNDLQLNNLLSDMSNINRWDTITINYFITKSSKYIFEFNDTKNFIKGMIKIANDSEDKINYLISILDSITEDEINTFYTESDNFRNPINTPIPLTIEEYDRLYLKIKIFKIYEKFSISRFLASFEKIKGESSNIYFIQESQFINHLDFTVEDISDVIPKYFELDNAGHAGLFYINTCNKTFNIIDPDTSKNTIDQLNNKFEHIVSLINEYSCNILFKGSMQNKFSRLINPLYEVLCLFISISMIFIIIRNTQIDYSNTELKNQLLYKDNFNIEEFKAMNYSPKQQKELMKKNYKNYIIIIGKLIKYIINKNEIDIDIYEL